MTDDNATNNKVMLIQRAFGTFLATKDTSALEPVLSDDFIHHRPDSSTLTKPEWLAAIRRALGPLAGMRVEVLHLLADGDQVVMHSRRWLPDGGPEIVVVDIWRFADGLVAEAWEIIEPAADAPANFRWWQPAA